MSIIGRYFQRVRTSIDYSFSLPVQYKNGRQFQRMRTSIAYCSPNTVMGRYFQRMRTSIAYLSPCAMQKRTTSSAHAHWCCLFLSLYNTEADGCSSACAPALPIADVIQYFMKRHCQRVHTSVAYLSPYATQKRTTMSAHAHLHCLLLSLYNTEMEVYFAACAPALPIALLIQYSHRTILSALAH